MRHVQIDALLRSAFSNATGKKDKRRLDRAHKLVTSKAAGLRQAYINSNGVSKWSPIKNRLTSILGNKCWYTEAELIGASLTIDHYRPKCDYWFLAFKAENYRVACPFANSPKHNEEHGCAGGKGDAFPLLDPKTKAKGLRSIKRERPVILDPCSEFDCQLVAFLPDGRPVIHPDFRRDSVAVKRVEDSKILLNLDHPDFNAQRERLCNEIAADVKIFEELPVGAAGRASITSRLKERLSARSPFSSAAHYYLRQHRHHAWVETLLATA
ncbi:MAG: hypothetical protein AB7I04_08465 [Pseudomonadales bacterium]